METKIRINSYLYIIFLILIVSCENMNTNEVYGKWGIIDVYYKDFDISGRDQNSSVIFTITMFIDKSTKRIVLPVKSDKNELGSFKLYGENGIDSLEIYDATDERFNGKYVIRLHKGESLNYGKSQEYSLEMESKNVYISGIKTVAHD